MNAAAEIPACGNCRHSVQDVDPLTLYCHRYPPQLVDIGVSELAALWPMVDAADLCGEHQP